MNISQTDNEILIDGEKAGFIRKDGKLQMLAGNAKLRPKILAWMEKSTPEPPAVKESLTAQGASSSQLRVEPEVSHWEPSPGTDIPRNPTPPCPPMNPMQGDKTPEVVAWYANHRPSEYKSRYAGRKHLSPNIPH